MGTLVAQTAQERADFASYLVTLIALGTIVALASLVVVALVARQTRTAQPYCADAADETVCDHITAVQVNVTVPRIDHETDRLLALQDRAMAARARELAAREANLALREQLAAQHLSARSTAQHERTTPRIAAAPVIEDTYRVEGGPNPEALPDATDQLAEYAVAYNLRRPVAEALVQQLTRGYRVVQNGADWRLYRRNPPGWDVYRIDDPRIRMTPNQAAFMAEMQSLLIDPADMPGSVQGGYSLETVPPRPTAPRLPAPR